MPYKKGAARYPFTFRGAVQAALKAKALYSAYRKQTHRPTPKLKQAVKKTISKYTVRRRGRARLQRRHKVRRQMPGAGARALLQKLRLEVVKLNRDKEDLEQPIQVHTKHEYGTTAWMRMGIVTTYGQATPSIDHSDLVYDILSECLEKYRNKMNAHMVKTVGAADTTSLSKFARRRCAIKCESVVLTYQFKLAQGYETFQLSPANQIDHNQTGTVRSSLWPYDRQFRIVVLRRPRTRDPTTVDAMRNPIWENATELWRESSISDYVPGIPPGHWYTQDPIHKYNYAHPVRLTDKDREELVGDAQIAVDENPVWMFDQLVTIRWVPGGFTVVPTHTTLGTRPAGTDTHHDQYIWEPKYSVDDNILTVTLKMPKQFFKCDTVEYDDSLGIAGDTPNFEGGLDQIQVQVYNSMPRSAHTGISATVPTPVDPATGLCGQYPAYVKKTQVHYRVATVGAEDFRDYDEA